MNKKVKSLLFVVYLFVGFLVLVTPLAAQDYPKGPVQIVIPYAPGGGVDLLWRIVGDQLSKILKVPIVYVNKGGGGGIIGMASVVNAKPDGYTLCALASDTLNVAPLFNKDIPFDTINDVTYMAKAAMFPQGVLVRGESPFKTIDEFIAFAKANPKKLKAGTPGIGSTGYLSVSLFNKDAGVEVVPVGFSGGGEVVPALLGGHVDCAFMGNQIFASYLATGRVRLLTFFSKKRHPSFPDVPSSVEKGLKRTVAEVGMGLVGPKGLSPEIVKKWEMTIRQVLKDPQVVKAIERLDYVIDPESGEEFKKEIADEYAVFKEIAVTISIKK
jgi:tripartite-type tricarboxylate transporter receptor subunit TctC